MFWRKSHQDREESKGEKFVFSKKKGGKFTGWGIEGWCGQKLGGGGQLSSLNRGLPRLNRERLRSNGLP